MRPDLFTWKDEQEAAAEVEEAHAARAEADRKYRLAPHGEVRARYEHLKAATRAALAAEIYLARVRGQS